MEDKKTMSERKYFPINESSARTAHNMMSMRDYSEGSTTSAYRSEVDKAYELADKVAEKSVFCQALFPEKSVRIPCFRQGNFPAFGGAQLRIPTHEGMLHPVAFSLKD